MKPLRISEPAAFELAEAVRWHEERQPGWGARLFQAVTQPRRSRRPIPSNEAVHRLRISCATTVTSLSFK